MTEDQLRMALQGDSLFVNEAMQNRFEVYPQNGIRKVIYELLGDGKPRTCRMIAKELGYKSHGRFFSMMQEMWMFGIVTKKNDSYRRLI